MRQTSRHPTNITSLLVTIAIVSVSAFAGASSGKTVQDRIDADIAAGRPIVVHVIVALCDNANQGIVPVPASLGNGQDPNSNLYWGALYGVRTHLPHASDWTRHKTKASEDKRILDRLVFHTNIRRGAESVPVYVVADAWDGSKMREALKSYLQMSAGLSIDRVVVGQGPESKSIRAGGAAHLLAFVGHNGLMDFSLDSPEPPADDVEPRSSIILACASKSYFLPHLQASGAHPLLLTTGLMAPEAYTLDAAMRAWISAGTAEAVHEAAAKAYNTYQKCGIKGARRLFWGAP